MDINLNWAKWSYLLWQGIVYCNRKPGGFSTSKFTQNVFKHLHAHSSAPERNLVSNISIFPPLSRRCEALRRDSRGMKSVSDGVQPEKQMHGEVQSSEAHSALTTLNSPRRVEEQLTPEWLDPSYICNAKQSAYEHTFVWERSTGHDDINTHYSEVEC